MSRAKLLNKTEKIFFFHNPKAGGSSLRKVFEAHFPAERRCPIIENDRENVTRAESDKPANPGTVDDRIQTLILAKNDLDFALYRYAVRRLVTQVTDHPIGSRNIIRRGTRTVLQLLARKRSEPRVQ